MEKIKSFLESLGAFSLAVTIISMFLLIGLAVNIYLGIRLLKFFIFPGERDAK
ncbi:MAG: hypothetical protein UR66_C0002G0106 [Candidatus Moranbacteria bacterium GW2011_GWE1_35_17]|nr:MAG: hypothetical protein UR66_C0002G0106 [Candidatus Moranbacteria bacterium GW2011_GWE1_35_17]KKP70426.1 MAG: hypothetical protein UR65_C0042G0010 [Candidatus Moranbacteria bacterium GW2011_GWE2_35_164]KKP82581.1 MAG: hypothetical protein UR82_C0036G0003 [Candidatus Moranbacteria bacterium GW2011_GWF1_35_5]